MLMKTEKRRRAGVCPMVATMRFSRKIVSIHVRKRPLDSSSANGKVSHFTGLMI